MRNWRFAAASAFLLCTAMNGAPASAQGSLERGRYLATIMDCGGCHTPGALRGAPDAKREFAGSDIGFQFPGGIVYPPNLTSHPTTGLGEWSEADIVHAVREGVRPDGRELVPIMPWPHYAALTDEDARALAAFIKSLPPIENAVPGPVGPTEKPPAPYLSILVP